MRDSKSRAGRKKHRRSSRRSGQDDGLGGLRLASYLGVFLTELSIKQVLLRVSFST